MPADHQERGFQHDETGELLLPPGLGQQEQGVPALLSQSRLQALCEGEDDAAAQAHVSLQDDRKLNHIAMRRDLQCLQILKNEGKISKENAFKYGT